MAMSIKSLYWLRIVGAGAALLLALAYMGGYVAFALLGFGFIGFMGGIIGYRINRGTLPATCDLCGGKGLFGAEYGHGFRNARLILNCPTCGRVVSNEGPGGKAKREGRK